MDQLDLIVRNATYHAFVTLGRAPTVDDVAGACGESVRDITAAWQRLHDAHALVLFPGSGALHMVNPFSAVPTPHRVEADGRSWYGNCAWDAFGICAALHVDGRIHSTCPDCGDTIVVDVREGRASDENLLFHCLVPAAHWWDDIAFT